MSGLGSQLCLSIEEKEFGSIIQCKLPQQKNAFAAIRKTAQKTSKLKINLTGSKPEFVESRSEVNLG